MELRLTNEDHRAPHRVEITTLGWFEVSMARDLTVTSGGYAGIVSLFADRSVKLFAVCSDYTDALLIALQHGPPAISFDLPNVLGSDGIEGHSDAAVGLFHEAMYKSSTQCYDG